jgi:hypothetical protein
MRTITPSDIGPWDGTPVEGSPYTVQQHHYMKAERPRWTKFQCHMVTLKWPGVTQWTPPTETQVACPIIARTKDRKRVLIIAPAGDKLWMNAACALHSKSASV